MKVLKTEIADLYIIEPKVFTDERGYFFESFNQAKFSEKGLNYNFIQDNQARSQYGVIRGLHFQKGEFAQAKLVRVLSGKIIDVALDLRKDSPTYGKCFSIELSEENKLQLLIPRGFAHGYSVISAEAVVFYKCDNIYMPSADGGIIFDDRELAIDWKIAENERIVSAKDKVNPTFEQYRLENL